MTSCANCGKKTCKFTFDGKTVCKRCFDFAWSAATNAERRGAERTKDVVFRLGVEAGKIQERERINELIDNHSFGCNATNNARVRYHLRSIRKEINAVASDEKVKR